MIRAKDPSSVFIAETWADKARLKEVQRKIEFDNLFFVERKNRGGGLALYWRNYLDLSIDTFSKNHIDVIIKKGKEDAWRFTGFYGKPVTHKRFESWNMLHQLNNKFNLLWLYTGDFNEIVQSFEKLEGSNRSQDRMRLFRDVVDDYGFLNLGFVGSPYTWQKHFADGHLIWERLDRGFATNDWLMKFSRLRIHHLSSDSSDHCPLWIIPNELEVATVPKLFPFEEMWLLDPSYSNVIEAVWSSNVNDDPSVKVVRKIEKCGKELQRWNRDHFGNVSRELAKKRKLLVEAEKEAWRSVLNY